MLLLGNETSAAQLECLLTVNDDGNSLRASHDRTRHVRTVDPGTVEVNECDQTEIKS